MSFTLGEFHALVSDALGRGTSLDSLIPVRTKLAARWIEGNYLFQYMRTWKVLNVDITAEYPYILSLHDLNIRGIEAIRLRDTDSDGNIVFHAPLKKINPVDRSDRPAGVPESYWLNGMSSIILGSIPDENMVFEAHLQQFTKWGSGDSWRHYMLDNMTNMLLARTLMMMSVRIRDPALYGVYKSEFDLEVQSFNVSEEELKSGEVVQVWEPPVYAQSTEPLRST